MQFLKTFFIRKPVGAFFPISVTLATASLVILIQRIVEVAATPFDVVGLTLVSTLFALGVVEHWFMLLPLPAITLWGWGMRSGFSPEDTTMEQGPRPQELAPPRPISSCCRACDPMRRRQTVAIGLRAAAAGRPVSPEIQRATGSERSGDGLSIGAEPAATVNGRTS